jgi:hypothetical protein
LLSAAVRPSARQPNRNDGPRGTRNGYFGAEPALWDYDSYGYHTEREFTSDVSLKGARWKRSLTGTTSDDIT